MGVKINPIVQAAADWEAEAIEQCRNDPALMKRLNELDICVVCMVKRPCLCERKRIKELEIKQPQRLQQMKRIWKNEVSGWLIWATVFAFAAVIAVLGLAH